LSDAPAGYSPITTPPLQGWVLTAHAAGLASALAEAAPGRRLAGGRGHVQVVEVGEITAVIRRYRRGGLMRLLGERYLSNRPGREFDVLLEAQARRLPAPTPLGVAWERRGLWYTGKLATAYLPGEDLDQALQRSSQFHWESPDEDPKAARPSPRQAGSDHASPSLTGSYGEPVDCVILLEACGALFRTFHDAGLYHADLQVKNVRVTPGGLVLLDFDNARFHHRLSQGQRARNLLRFRRSLEKNALPRHYFTSLCAGYGAVSIPLWLQFLYTFKGRLSNLLSGRRTHL
jgi:3-deoxy-D-manno-octulosonic acid kinase